jgi:guanosine-3',5'-bis(diphosphate) 3'-pyrophosphohydrolase
MKQEWSSLLVDGIYFSPSSLSFYKGFYAGLGMDDIRELPTSVNNYLNLIVDLNSLVKEGRIVGACVGRYRYECEAGESGFDFEGYFTDLIPIDFDEHNDTFCVNEHKVSKRLTKALSLAADAHAEQRRKSDNSPYIGHLLEVQDLLVNVGEVLDEDIIIAGLLHDVIEDSAIDKLELTYRFGSRVACIVSSLTDNKTLSLAERRENTLKKLKSSPRSVKLVKLADITSNASSIPAGWTTERLNDYFFWLDKVAAICRDASPELYKAYQSTR